MSNHHCHYGHHCKVETPPRLLFCKYHWSLVPKDIQDKIWKAYKTNKTEMERCHSVEYMEACADAQDSVAKQLNETIHNSYRNIANHLKKKKLAGV